MGPCFGGRDAGRQLRMKEVTLKSCAKGWVYLCRSTCAHRCFLTINKPAWAVGVSFPLTQHDSTSRNSLALALKAQGR